MNRLDVLKSLRSSGISVLDLKGKTDQELETMLSNLTEQSDCKIDPNAFSSYISQFNSEGEKEGFDVAFIRWTQSNACGCLGPINGNPYCECQMRVKTANMFGKINYETN